MNIFATDPSPRLCAEVLDDKRLIKMCLETAQILSTSIRKTYTGTYDISKLYRPTHKNHPCVAWAGAALNNTYWLRDHLRYLLAEYTERFNKVHASTFILDIVSDIYIGSTIPSIKFVNCARNTGLNLDFTHHPVYEAYRLYLCARWDLDKRKPKWTIQDRQPRWYVPLDAVVECIRQERNNSDRLQC